MIDKLVFLPAISATEDSTLCMAAKPRLTWLQSGWEQIQQTIVKHKHRQSWPVEQRYNSEEVLRAQSPRLQPAVRQDQVLLNCWVTIIVREWGHPESQKLIISTIVPQLWLNNFCECLRNMKEMKVSATSPKNMSKSIVCQIFRL